jgi:NAD(P)-dependent dehydrogenase (short-subunit alcohol dehydrogenase family)
MSTERSLREMMSLHGRVAVVTGGAGHIGRAIASGLAELGATIALVDIAASAGTEAAAKLAADHTVKAAMFDCDFEQGDAVKNLPRRVREALTSLSIARPSSAPAGWKAGRYHSSNSRMRPGGGRSRSTSPRPSC